MNPNLTYNIISILSNELNIIPQILITFKRRMKTPYSSKIVSACRTIRQLWLPPRCSCCNNFRRQQAPRLQLRQVLAQAHCRAYSINCCSNSTSVSAQQLLRMRPRQPYRVRRKSTLRICRDWRRSRLWVTPPVSMVGVDLLYLLFSYRFYSSLVFFFAFYLS